MSSLFLNRPKGPKARCAELTKWEHDLYVPEKQKPREQWEKEKVRITNVKCRFYLFTLGQKVL